MCGFDYRSFILSHLLYLDFTYSPIASPVEICVQNLRFSHVRILFACAYMCLFYTREQDKVEKWMN